MNEMIQKQDVKENNFSNILWAALQIPAALEKFPFCSDLVACSEHSLFT